VCCSYEYQDTARLCVYQGLITFQIALRYHVNVWHSLSIKVYHFSFCFAIYPPETLSKCFESRAKLTLHILHFRCARQARLIRRVLRLSVKFPCSETRARLKRSILSAALLVSLLFFGFSFSQMLRVTSANLHSWFTQNTSKVKTPAKLTLHT